MGGYGKFRWVWLVGLLMFVAAVRCRGQRTARLTPPCAEPLRQAAELMTQAEYRPAGIAGYDSANQLIWDAGERCQSHGDVRLYNAARHMLSLARAVEQTRSRVAKELSTAGNVNAGESWGLAADDPRWSVVTERASGCQRAILAAVRDRRVTVRVEACDLKAYE